VIAPLLTMSLPSQVVSAS